MLRWTLSAALLIATASCDGAPPAAWQVVHEDLPGALLSVWGTAADDVWTVGADAGDGPIVLHYDGAAWERMETGHTGNLWWVFGFEGGPVYLGGDGGAILRYQDGVFTPMTTPGRQTVFGIWGIAPDDVWAVGGEPTGNGFAWRLEGDAWVEEPTLPADVPGRAAIWKVHGRAADDVWLVGSNGVSLRWDGATLTEGATGVGTSLFTVHSNAERFAAVGGAANGIIVEWQDGSWRDVTADSTMPSLSGVVLGEGESGVAVGAFGGVYTRDASGWHAEDTGIRVDQNLHGVWLDPDGGIWAAGGQTFSPPLTEGVLIHYGEPVAGGER